MICNYLKRLDSGFRRKDWGADGRTGEQAFAGITKKKPPVCFQAEGFLGLQEQFVAQPELVW